MARRAVNTNRQGANFELQIMKDLTRYGYIAHRSSGSHGAVDVVAVGDMETLVIQAKISSAVIPPKERAAVLDLAARMGPSAVPMCAYRAGGKVFYRVLTGQGPKDFLLWEPEPLRYAICSACLHTYGWHTGDQATKGCWLRTGDWSCRCLAFVLDAPAEGTKPEGQPLHSEDVCPGFPERCPSIRTVPADPPTHYGGIRCGCADTPAP